MDTMWPPALKRLSVGSSAHNCLVEAVGECMETRSEVPRSTSPSSRLDSDAVPEFLLCWVSASFCRGFSGKDSCCLISYLIVVRRLVYSPPLSSKRCPPLRASQVFAERGHHVLTVPAPSPTLSVPGWPALVWVYRIIWLDGTERSNDGQNVLSRSHQSNVNIH